MNLRPYQTKGFNEIIDTWDNNNENKEFNPIMFVLATGGGKTVTFVHVIKHYLKQNARIYLVAHREELISQAHKTLSRNGISAGIIKADFPQRFEFLTQVCSIQTIARRGSLPPADVIIIDEGHHVARDNEYGKFLKRNPNAKILVVTATPYRMDGKGFLGIVEGRRTKLIVNKTAKQLIDDGYLVPFKYFIASLPKLDNIRIVRGDYSDEEAHDAMKLVPVVESYIKYAKGMKGICYAVNVKHSLELTSQFLNYGVNAAHLDANTPKDERTRILLEFKEGIIKVVVNVGILTEGADFPDCQFVQLARPTKSLSMYLQMVGRVTRPSIDINVLETSSDRKKAIMLSGKPNGIILDCSKCWEDHGFPDNEIDWVPYFEGKKDKKKVDLGMIEIYVIEDPETGIIKRTKKIEETEGAILIEVTEEVRKALNQKNPITEFNKIYFLSKRLKHVQKKGFFIWYEFKKLMDKGEIQPTQEVFNFIERKLITEPKEEAERNNIAASTHPLKIPTYFFEQEKKAYLH